MTFTLTDLLLLCVQVINISGCIIQVDLFLFLHWGVLFGEVYLAYEARVYE